MYDLFKDKMLKEKVSKPTHTYDTLKYVLFGNIGMWIFTSRFTGFILFLTFRFEEPTFACY